VQLASRSHLNPEPEPPSEGRRARRNRETRSALLAAALELLRERGIYGTRVEDITERADVGKGVFYNHFESKETLFAQLLQEAVDLLERDYLTAVGEEASLDRRIERLALAQEAFFRDHPEYAMVIHQARGLLLIDPDGAASLRDAFSDYMSRMSRWIPAPHDGGGWATSDLLSVAAAIAGSAAGYRSFCIAVGRPIDTDLITTVLVSGVPHVLRERRRARKVGSPTASRSSRSRS
jgi:AcrR family transcriptional regulator